MILKEEFPLGTLVTGEFKSSNGRMSTFALLPLQNLHSPLLCNPTY